MKKGLQPSEHSEQHALVQWCKLMEPQIPELGLLFAIPNGGFRHWKTAAYLKAEGVKAGIPDLFLAVASLEAPRLTWDEIRQRPARPVDYYGLFIEMKRPGGAPPTKIQMATMSRLRGQGYEVQVCYGFDEAKAVILRYLGWDVE